ncbi:MAG: type II toxin-antitoxin system PemK/MazF family toxin [Candidatus Auribacterota bacterium]|nr:type II toxin-antitoxin system PemK/MazF family toxin [Candidatus Auribacterota bacterium]
MRRGEIWWASLPEPEGSEPGYRRPVVIIQGDNFNQSNINTVVCSSITSNLKIANAPGNLRLPARVTGLRKPSVVNVSQLVTVDKRFLSKKVKTLEGKIMRRIDDGIRLVLNL